ncbi:hypothetical protein HUK80_17670 [Flavobacterium sp. MAH-1]|uniref:Uncharacterized protein n=1 Tax=Flavobacterium agri TaxID=2743471 RepID=A0A7Y8Y534_9FLAO|nr:hypothetical protein [Flavobacterium agri]NUY82736.1 hypothetical protein [Flavobacterium agri]NYA72759.1 hypothetical protein [Flavobacterium agri]
MNKKHPFEKRLWWRTRLPWFLINLGIAGKGKDCELLNAAHKWYNADGINSGCYYCKKTTQQIKW